MADRMRRLIAVDAAMLGLLALLFLAWFAGLPYWLHPSVALALLLAAAALRLRLQDVGLPGLPGYEMLAPLFATVLFRWPALLNPWGWVNRDGAYGAFVALHLVQGLRPAPVFTEGANYQGTLKGHIAALLWMVTGLRDLSLLMEIASVTLYLVFVAASVALARRVAGRSAGLFCGLYLALSPRFLTSFSLNCVGQYMDVLALGGLALALLARLLDEERSGASARTDYTLIGLLLGVAFWQQPVALCYLVCVAIALGVRRRSWSDPWVLLAPVGLIVGLVPVLAWNLRHGWATSEILARDPQEAMGQIVALGESLRRTLDVAFPILAGLSPNHPGRRLPGVAAFATLLLPLTLLAYAAWSGRRILRGLRVGRPTSAMLPLLLSAISLGIFWLIAAGSLYRRPRYLLPMLALTAVQLGILLALLWARQRVVAAALLVAVLALNVTGSWPRLQASASVAALHARTVRALQEKGIRTGYADFSISAPVTMFTAEQITLSPALGPTPAYESDIHAQRVAREGPDAFVLRANDDPARFAARLDELGVKYMLDLDPLPIFHGLSARVPVEQVRSYAGEAPGAEE